MAKNYCIALLVLLLYGSTAGIAQQTDIRTVYTSQIGVRELSGKNDGKDVEKYLRSVGLGKGYAWCSAFVHWSLEQTKTPNTINGYSPTAHNKNNIVYFQRKSLKPVQAGDVFTLWFASLGRIAHTGFLDRKINSSIFETIEGNTNEAGSREGDGVYRKRRSFNSTYSITRWVKTQ